MSRSCKYSYVVYSKDKCVGAYRNITKARKKLMEVSVHDEDAFITKWENGLLLGRYTIYFTPHIQFLGSGGCPF